MKFAQGFKLISALLLLCACVKIVSGVAFPGGTDIPTANFASNLVLSSNVDDFPSATLNTAWTVVGAPGFVGGSTAQIGGSTYATNYLKFTNSETSGGTAAYSLTWTPQTLGAGVRIVARIQASQDALGTTAGPVSMIGWAETTTASSAKIYAAAAESHGTTAGATNVVQQIGYYDPSLAAGSQNVLSSATGLDATPAAGTIVMVDVQPKNISWGMFDMQNQTPSCGLYKNCYGASANTQITAQKNGAMVIGGSNKATGTLSIILNVDWIAQYNFVSSGSLFSSSKLTISLLSVLLSAFLVLML